MLRISFSGKYLLIPHKITCWYATSMLRLNSKIVVLLEITNALALLHIEAAAETL